MYTSVAPRPRTAADFIVGTLTFLGGLTAILVCAIVLL